MMKKIVILGLGLVLFGISQVEAGGNISGSITTLAGIPTAGVQVTLSGSISSVTTTSTGGTYSFSGLDNGSYVVTPAKLWHTFSPASKTVSISGANVNNVNFTANYGPPTIRVTHPSAGQVITSEGSITTTFNVENFSIDKAPEGYYEGYIILVSFIVNRLI